MENLLDLQHGYCDIDEVVEVDGKEYKAIMYLTPGSCNGCAFEEIDKDSGVGDCRAMGHDQVMCWDGRGEDLIFIAL